MRDRNRIDFFLIEFGELWKKFPDLRFGQLIENLRDYYEDQTKRDFYYIEDEDFLKILQEYMRWLSNVKQN